MDVVVIGTHEYEWAIHPFAHLFAKYWGDDVVTWYGDRVSGPMPGNVEFKVVPGYEGDWRWRYAFGDGFARVLGDLEGRVFMLFLLDHWLNAPADRDGLELLKEHMEREGNILRCNVCDDLEPCLATAEWFHVGDVDGYELVTIPPSDPQCGFVGGVTFSPALWNGDILRELLEPHWTLSVTELDGTRKFNELGLFPTVMSVGARPQLLWFAHMLRHAQPGSVHHRHLLKPEDREAVKEMIPEGWL